MNADHTKFILQHITYEVPPFYQISSLKAFFMILEALKGHKEAKNTTCFIQENKNLKI